MLNSNVIYKDGYILTLPTNTKYNIWTFIYTVHLEKLNHDNVKYVQINSLIYLVL